MATIAKLQKSISDSEDGPKLPPAKEETLWLNLFRRAVSCRCLCARLKTPETRDLSLMQDLDKIDETFQFTFRELAKIKAELVVCQSETMTPELLSLSFILDPENLKPIMPMHIRSLIVNSAQVHGEGQLCPGPHQEAEAHLIFLVKLFWSFCTRM